MNPGAMNTSGVAANLIALFLVVTPATGTASHVADISRYRLVPTIIGNAPRENERASEIGSSAAESVLKPEYLQMQTFRPTTPTEELIGTMRAWSSWTTNWDGEGGQAPDAASISEAVAFVRLLESDIPLPDAMLLANGRAGLYWNDLGVYGDLEFTGNSLVTYYIEQEGGKHKGVVPFDLKHLPRVFSTLLAVRSAA